MRIALRSEVHPSAGTGSATATPAANVAYLLSPEPTMHTRRVANVVAIVFGLTAAITAVLLLASGW
jgi:hypothetical protein